MELNTYIRLARKWFWLLFLGAFLAGGAAFLFSSREPDLYRSQVMISVGTAMKVPNPQYTEFIVGSELAQTYAVLARSYDVAEAAVEAGNFPVSPGGLRNMISVSVIEETSLMVLSVTYTDPVLAADMANEIANQLILSSPSNLTPEQQDQIDLANEEIRRLREELDIAREEQRAIDAQIAAATDLAEITQLREQRNQLATQINQASMTIAQFNSTISTLQQASNSLEIVESARIQGAPTGNNVFSRAVIGALVGAVLAGGLALGIEYLDDTIQSPAEATQALALPTLAAISRFGKPRDQYTQQLVTYRDPGSPVSEEYRTLRTNLLFSSNGSAGKGVYIVTSPGPSEGKSVTVANLAVTMAMAGWRVLLVDADLRRPRLHEIFSLDNNIGLSTLLSLNPGELAADDGKLGLQQRLAECIQDTEIPGLQIITSGHIPLNPTEVLGSASMQRWFQEFRSPDHVDIVLFDTPPALVVADSSVLASAIDVPVVMVVEAKSTRRGAALRTKEQFEQLGVQVQGVVLNGVNPRDRGTYDYGYHYYYYYYTESDGRSGSSS